MTTTGATPEWTYSEYARLPDDGHRYEVIDGVVSMTPAPGPRHQRVAAELFFTLRQYVERHEIGEMLWDVDLLFVTGQYLRPDMLFVPAAAAGSVTDRGMEGTPGLVVEVASPHSRRIDRIRKPPRYRAFGVPEYWVVDPDTCTIERYRLGSDDAPERCRVALEWQPEPGVPALRIDVPRIFGRG
jgi:Uma2 family endonuclease